MADAPQSVRLIRIFVSSPNDVAEEREVLEEVVDRINRTQGQDFGLRLETFRYEKDVVPQIGPDAQRVVDAQTPSCDIYLGIMAHRMGTPTGDYESGTEKEFNDVLNQWGSKGSPWILFYFAEAQADPSKLDPEQFAKVCKFREQVEEKGLHATYRGVRGHRDAFFDRVDMHLRRIVSLLNKQQVKKPNTTAGELTAAGIDRLVCDLHAIRQNQSSAHATVDLLLKTAGDARWTRLELSDRYQRHDLEGMILNIDRAITAHDRAMPGGLKVECAKESIKALVKLVAGFLVQESTLSMQFMQSLCNAALLQMKDPVCIDTNHAEKLHLRACNNQEEALDELLDDIFEA